MSIERTILLLIGLAAWGCAIWILVALGRSRFSRTNENGAFTFADHGEQVRVQMLWKLGQLGFWILLLFGGLFVLAGFVAR